MKMVRGAFVVAMAGLAAAFAAEQQAAPLPALKFFQLSAESKPWHPQPEVQDAPVVKHQARIVDYGDDFMAFREGDQFMIQGKGWSAKPYQVVETGHDLDGDGDKDDSITYVSSALEDPCPPPWAWDWDLEGTGARFYSARTSYCLNTGNERRGSIGENGGPNVNHSMGADDINMMGWTPTDNRHLQPVMGSGLWLWKKADFMNGGDVHRVSFDKDSLISLHIPRYCHEVMGGRMVVLDDQGYWISE